MTRALYRLLLRLYPEEFRERFGDEMVELAHQQRYRPWLLVRDVATSLVTAHAAARRGRKTHYRKEAMGGLGKDFAVALRGIRNAPGFAAIAVVTIALGIGANTAIFSVVNAVVLRPLPYESPERLVNIASVLTHEGRHGPLSLPDVEDIRERSESFDAVAAYRFADVTLTGSGEPEVVPGGTVGGDLMNVFGVRPIMGRDLRIEDDVLGGDRVAVISYAFWQERLGGSADVLGETLTLDADQYTIVGVAPAGFDFPGNALLWKPLYVDVENCGRGCQSLRVVARLAPKATVALADEELSVIAAQLSDAYPNTNSGKSFDATRLDEALVGADVRTALYVLFGAVGVVLVIASANVAHLLLARASGRRNEMAVRAALGASRARLVRQLLVESLVLASLGGIAGWVLARWALVSIIAIAPDNLPRMESVTLDGTVLAFTLVATSIASVLFGLAPALSLSRTTVSTSRHIGVNAPTGGASRPLLLAFQVALSVVLLFGAGLLLRSFSELRAQPLGFDEDRALTFTVSLPDARYEDPMESVRFFDELETSLSSLPTVRAVGAVYGSPMSLHGRMTADVTLLDRPEPPPGEENFAAIRAVTPGYLPALGVPVVSGRGIDEHDRTGAPRVALVNESFVKLYYPDKDPVGELIRLHGSFGFRETEPRAIVGVVGDFRSSRVSEPPKPEVWAPQAQMGSTYLTVLVRARGAPETLLPEVRARVHELDPNLPLRHVETLATAVERSFGATRFYSLLLALFAALAVVLASVGVYGVVSYVVSRRTQEIGLRMALGADAHDVIRLILSEGLRPAVIGVAVGVGGALACGRLLESMLYNVQPIDVWTLVLATLALLVAAVPALVLPARRASLVSPLSSLRLD